MRDAVLGDFGARVVDRIGCKGADARISGTTCSLVCLLRGGGTQIPERGLKALVRDVGGLSRRCIADATQQAHVFSGAGTATVCDCYCCACLLFRNRH